MTPEGKEKTSTLIQALKKNGVKQVKEVLYSFLEASKWRGKLKLDEHYAFFDDLGEQEQERNPDKVKCSRKSKDNLEVSLDEVMNLDMQQAKARYSMGCQRISQIAGEIGTVIRIGNKKLSNREWMDAYFLNRAN